MHGWPPQVRCPSEVMKMYTKKQRSYSLFPLFLMVKGVKSDATEEEIRKSFRELSKKYHPDKNPSGAEMYTKLVEGGYQPHHPPPPLPSLSLSLSIEMSMLSDKALLTLSLLRAPRSLCQGLWLTHTSLSLSLSLSAYETLNDSSKRSQYDLQRAKSSQQPRGQQQQHRSSQPFFQWSFYGTRAKHSGMKEEEEEDEEQQLYENKRHHQRHQQQQVEEPSYYSYSHAYTQDFFSHLDLGKERLRIEETMKRAQDKLRDLSQKLEQRMERQREKERETLLKRKQQAEEQPKEKEEEEMKRGGAEGSRGWAWKQNHMKWNFGATSKPQERNNKQERRRRRSGSSRKK